MTPFELTQIAEARGWRVTEHAELHFYLAPPESLEAPIDVEIMRRSAEILLPHVKQAYRNVLEAVVQPFDEQTEAYRMLEQQADEANLRPIGQVKTIFAQIKDLGASVKMNVARGDVSLILSDKTELSQVTRLFHENLSDLQVGLLRAYSAFFVMPIVASGLRASLKRPKPSAA